MLEICILTIRFLWAPPGKVRVAKWRKLRRACLVRVKELPKFYVWAVKVKAPQRAQVGQKGKVE